MSIRAEVVGGTAAIAKLTRKLSAVEIEAVEGLKTSNKFLALLIHSNAVRSIQKQDGFADIRYKPFRRVTVSEPRNPPNTDTGRLVQSIKFEFENGGLVAYVGTNLNYGAWLEFGTVKMKARPWLRPAIRSAQKTYGQRARIVDLTREIKGAAKK